MLFMIFWNILLQNHKVFEQIKRGVGEDKGRRRSRAYKNLWKNGILCNG